MFAVVRFMAEFDVIVVSPVDVVSFAFVATEQVDVSSTELMLWGASVVSMLDHCLDPSIEDRTN
jgi:hypothetical protein